MRDHFEALSIHDWQGDEGITDATMIASAIEAAALTIADALRNTESGDHDA